MSLKSFNKVDTNRYELDIVIDAERFAAARTQAYRKNVKTMNVPGFRKGKAPQSIIEKLYGEEIFFDDALNSLYPAELREAVESAELEMVDDQTDFDLVTIGKDGAEFKVTITVKPEVNIKDYKGLKAEKAAVAVQDEEVDKELEQLLERNSRMVTVEGRAAKDGDTAIIDFEGFVDDVAFEGGKGEAYSLTLGSGQFIPGFEEQVIGHQTGDEFEVNVDFPQEYHAEELKGKAAVFKCTLHEIKEKELPELDDEFVKDVSEFDTLEQLKEDHRNQLLEQKEKKAEDDVENALIDQLIAHLEAEIPEAMYEQRIDDNLRDFDYRLQSQGMNLQTYMQYMGGDEKELRDSFRPQGERQVKVRLALEKIAELENLQPTQEEFEAELKRYAEMYKVSEEQIRIAIPEKDLKSDLATKKAIDFVKDHALITEVVASEDSAEKEE